jgi:hypothetical protein
MKSFVMLAVVCCFLTEEAESAWAAPAARQVLRLQSPNTAVPPRWVLWLKDGNGGPLVVPLVRRLGGERRGIAMSDNVLVNPHSVMKVNAAWLQPARNARVEVTNPRNADALDVTDELKVIEIDTWAAILVGIADHLGVRGAPHAELGTKVKDRRGM